MMVNNDKPDPLTLLREEIKKQRIEDSQNVAKKLDKIEARLRRPEALFGKHNNDD